MISQTDGIATGIFQAKQVSPSLVPRRTILVEDVTTMPIADVADIRSIHLDNEAQKPLSTAKETLNTDSSESLSVHQGLDVNRVLSLLDGL